MNNETKQYLALLEARVMKLENMLEAMVSGIHAGSEFIPSCNQCGCYNPQFQEGYKCSMPNCCQGLNPDDEK